MSEMHAQPDNKPDNRVNGAENAQYNPQVGDAPVSRQVDQQARRDDEKRKRTARLVLSGGLAVVVEALWA
jgi:hypothetical protein